MAAPSIAVARVLELGVPIQWEEAVAVASAAEADCWAHGTPVSLDNCLISASGAVRLDAAIFPRAGASLSPMQLLKALLEGQSAPRDLQALLATADDPLAGFPSEHDAGARLRFDLSAFVRPAPEADIARLAARALAVEAQTSALAALTERVVAARPEPPQVLAVTASPLPPAIQPAVPARSPEGRYVRLAEALRGRTAAIGVAAALILAIGVAALWLPGLVSGATPVAAIGPEPAVEGTEVAAADVTAAAIPSTIEPRRDSPPVTASRRSPPARSVQVRRGANAPLAADAAMAVPAPPPEIAPSTAGPSGQGLVAVPMAQPVVRIAPPDLRPAPSAAEVRAAPAPALRAAVPEREVYSSQDGGVEPPVSLRPHLPTEPRADSEQSGSFIELLVNERGEVERVRLRQSDASINDRMIVAAAKAWRFRPATRDGKPVAYVLQLPVNR